MCHCQTAVSSHEVGTIAEIDICIVVDKRVLRSLSGGLEVRRRLSQVGESIATSASEKYLRKMTR